ncbi:MAG: CBS domain-containing protein [Nitrospiraceae bacterium]|nr:CBS domain-containing protein [Nitrospiraceae bacterium]
MSFWGELFVSEILGKPVLDPKGEELGKVKELIVVKGDPLPKISRLIIERKRKSFYLPWTDLNIFNKRIISANVYLENLRKYQFNEEDLLLVRDVFDKQIVDVNGAKVVRVNDVKLEGLNTEAVLVAVDVGMRGIMRRLGVERGGEDFLRLFKAQLPYNMISWNYLQPLEPRLTAISLTIPRQMVTELHPADLAAIISQVSHKEGTTFLQDLDAETAADAISELEPETQTAIITDLDTEKASDIIEMMAPDEAADVLSDLPVEKAQKILGSLEKEDAEDIKELLGHEEDTAGGIMTNEFIAYRPETTVGETIERFRQDAEEVETVYYIYVTDAEEKLKGVVSLREILLSSPETKLVDIMEEKTKTVTPDADEMKVAGIISKYNLVALPVVDADGCMLGIVTIDDIIDRILPSAAKKTRRKV